MQLAGSINHDRAELFDFSPTAPGQQGNDRTVDGNLVGQFLSGAVPVRLIYLVSDGNAIPWRVRARSSSFCNLSVTAPLCAGCLIADIPAIVGSLDIVMGEIDR